MKITPVPIDTSNPLPEYGPTWMVSEGDRNVVHEITLAEVLGLDPLGGSESAADQHRLVAVNTLRNAIFATLRDGMPAEAVFPGVPEEQQGPFSRNARLAALVTRKLCERPGFEWPASHGFALSPFRLSLQSLVDCFRDGKRRHAGKRDEADRWWAIVISKLDEALAISEARLHG